MLAFDSDTAGKSVRRLTAVASAGRLAKRKSWQNGQPASTRTAGTPRVQASARPGCKERCSCQQVVVVLDVVVTIFSMATVVRHLCVSVSIACA